MEVEMWLCALASVAHADMFFGTVQRGAQTWVVTDPATEGPVRLTLPGRDGDRVSVDGWDLGVLPLDTVLAGGLHVFRIEGSTGALQVEIAVTPSKHQTVTLDLTPQPATPAAVPAAPATSAAKPGT